MDNRPLRKNHESLFSTPMAHQEATDDKRIIGYYKNRARVAVITNGSKFIEALKTDPRRSPHGSRAFQLMNWLTDKPRLAGENELSYILSTISPAKLSGHQIHQKQNLYIDNFNFSYQWIDNESRASEQIADLVLPNGQWHRHYNIVVLPADATNKQVEIICHWMTLTGGSVLILQDDNQPMSPHILKLIDGLTNNIEDITPYIPPVAVNTTKDLSGLQVTIYNQNTLKKINSVQIPHLRYYSAPLPVQTQDCLWIYEGVINIPKDGRIVFQIDTSYITDNISFSVNDQFITLLPEAEEGQIAIDGLKAGEQCTIKIITTTEGKPPLLRLGWGWDSPRAETAMKLIPKEAFQSTQSTMPIEITPPTIMTSSYLNKANESTKLNMGRQFVISLPPISVNKLVLTDSILGQVEYFSLDIKNTDMASILKLDNIEIKSNTTWENVAKNIEYEINQHLDLLGQDRITLHYADNHLIFSGEHYLFSQFQFKKKQKIPYLQLKPDIKTKIKSSETTHQIDFDANHLMAMTHLSFALNNKSGEQVNLNRVPFRRFNHKFASSTEFTIYLQRYLRYQIGDDSVSVILNNENNRISIIDKFNRNLEQLTFGIEEQILPFVVIQNTDNTADKLTVGDIRGRLPYHENILSYQLIESPQYGEVFLDAATGEWQYRPDPTQSFSGVEQFDCAVTFKNGMQSAPLSIQIQSEKAPFILRLGKKIFIVPDPIYAEPEARHQIVPVDMQVHAIQLAQLHLQSPDAPYFNLVSNRWALLKVDVTSQSNAEAPDFMVRITDKHGHLLGETRLIGPRHLPQSLLNMPNEPAVDQRVLHRYSYTAPLKGAWIQPNIRIQIMAGDTPITQPFTDNQGVFAPTISQDSHLITRVSTSNLYQQGHGTYAYSPISWGKEAIAKLPASQLSLYSYPSQPLSPALYPHFASRLTTHYLTIPSYDKSTPLIDDAASQISWAYDRSLILKRPNGLSEDLNYYAITPSINSSLLGLAVPHAGGGVASIDVLAHEAYGHGVGLPHTTHPDYPYDSKSNGTHAAYDPQLQRYMTYRSKEGDNINEIIPLMYPYAGERRLASYDAIAPHSDYDTQKALQFFQRVPRWMPNSQKGQDTEDSGFLGEGYYQRWSKQQGEWVTLTENNFAHYYNEQSQYLLPHQRDVPVYQLNGKIAKLADGQPHPYNELQINRTTGTLPADYHNIHTQEGRPYNSQWPYVLKIIYATPVGLHTEILQALPNIDSFSINIADKGELVSIEIIEINQQKQFGKMLHRYNNPEELTNRVFGPRNQNAQLKTLQLDNFWQAANYFGQYQRRNLLTLIRVLSTNNVLPLKVY